jgi:hypothetical protein
MVSDAEEKTRRSMSGRLRTRSPRGEMRRRPVAYLEMNEDIIFSKHVGGLTRLARGSVYARRHHN